MKAKEGRRNDSRNDCSAERNGVMNLSIRLNQINFKKSNIKQHEKY